MYFELSLPLPCYQEILKSFQHFAFLLVQNEFFRVGEGKYFSSNGHESKKATLLFLKHIPEAPNFISDFQKKRQSYDRPENNDCNIQGHSCRCCQMMPEYEE